MSMEWNKLLNSERPRRSSNPDGEHRIQFERDFDRAIFSTPLKRLQDKAQVFPLEPHDAVRTRLTHSLEVSAVARGLGIAISQWLLEKKYIEPGMERSIEAIAATCGLIHDLGNPPFGHSGEDAIHYWFKNRFGESGLRDILKDDQLIQDFLKFDGNAQSLRLVSKLQILADFKGLNLTFGTLSASCKYVSPSHNSGDEKDHAKSKPGYFASENDLVKQVREKTGTGEARNPITFLVEAADDIVYSVADVEDAIKKGVLAWREVQDSLKDSLSEICVEDSIAGMDRILKGEEGRIPEGLPDDVRASAFRTSVIGIMVKSTIKEFQGRYDLIMKGLYRSELVKDCTAWPLIEKLKGLGKARVYCTPSNLKLELMGRHVISDLMDVFWEGARELSVDDVPQTKTFPGKIGALLSNNYRRAFRHSMETMQELPEQYHRLQLVTDYVCGMTDTFAKHLHAELMNG